MYHCTKCSSRISEIKVFAADLNSDPADSVVKPHLTAHVIPSFPQVLSWNKAEDRNKKNMLKIFQF